MKKIPITEARRIAEACGAEAVVILAFGDDLVSGTSYGETMAKCKTTGKWMDGLIEKLCDGLMFPPVL
jgi:hypothetical protein